VVPRVNKKKKQKVLLGEDVPEQEQEKGEEEETPTKVRGSIASIFGDKFAEAYQKALAMTQKLSEERLNKIIAEAITMFRDLGDPTEVVKIDTFDVILAETPNNPEMIQIKKTSAGNYKIGMIWPGSKSLRGPWISVFVPTEEDAEALSEEGAHYLLVGKLREQTYQGDLTYNFRVAGFRKFEE